MKRFLKIVAFIAATSGIFVLGPAMSAEQTLDEILVTANKWIADNIAGGGGGGGGGGRGPGLTNKPTPSGSDPEQERQQICTKLSASKQKF